MDVAKLLCDRPHLIVSIEIPDETIEEMQAREGEVASININYRTLFIQLTGRRRKDEGAKRKEKTNSTSSTVADQADQAPDLSMIGKKSSNLFSSVIDKLERKFLAFETRHSVGDSLDDDQGSMSESSHVSSVATSPEADPTPVEALPARRVRKKKIFFDEYNYDDGFIDDSDAVQHIEGALKAKRLKTKHDGFFVSTGALELEPVPVKKATPKTAASSSKTATVNSSKSLAQTPPQLSGPLNAADAAKVASEETGEKKLKPWWTPHAEVSQAMDNLKERVKALREEAEKDGSGKASKPSKSNNSAIPTALYDGIFAVHKVVRTYHSKRELEKHRGFIETLVDVLGGGNGGTLSGVESSEDKGVSAMKVKLLLNKLDLREAAKLEKEKMRGKVDWLKAGLKAVVVPCPDYKQPGYKSAKKSASGSKEGEAGAAGDDTAPSLVGDGSKLAEGPGVDGEAKMEIEDPVALTPSEPVQQPPTSPQPPSETAAAAAATAVIQQHRYDFFCKWTIPLRGEVVGLEEEIAGWVQAENKFREKLTNAEKQELEESEFVGLNPKDELQRVFEEIASIFPPNCLQGDLQALRAAIKTERLRVQNVKRKEAKALEQANASAASAITANAAVADTPAPGSPSPQLEQSAVQDVTAPAEGHPLSG